MKKHRFIYFGLILAFLLSGILFYRSKNKVDLGTENIAVASSPYSALNNSEYNSLLEGNRPIPKIDDTIKSSSTNTASKSSENTVASNKTSNTKTSTKSSTVKSTASTTKEVRLSRGGTTPQKSNKSTYSSKIEVLDWWKDARYIFDVDSIAKVTDVETKKSFNVKRTMGTNHADAEALTAEDTRIIKEIWGGFSWDRRSVIVTINGRRLAASMSAMPHAGIDSAPAFKVINNRSLGYGRGENLDVVKKNGMDGHFDIHFLNSTRHKDGKKDPEHQTAIKSVVN